MRPLSFLSRGGLALVVAALASCAGTKIVSSWAAPDHSKTSVKKVLVLGVSADTGLRRSYEEAFVARLTELGYAAIPGYQWVPDALKLDRDAVMARIKQEGVTHVLVTRLVSSQKIETHTSPGAVVAVGISPYGPGYYGGWSTYYSVSYTNAVGPEYQTVKDAVTLETNLYDAARKPDDAIVWTGQSETWMENSTTGEKIKSAISAIVYSMRASRAI